MDTKVARTMTVCHKSHRESEPGSDDARPGRAFLCTSYVADAQGQYCPTEGLTQCPWAKGAERCRLKKHDWRERKTGPCVPLRLMYCRSHDRYFTVYPMGHVPYSRSRVVPVDLAGHPVESSQAKRVSDQEAAERWEGSWFRSGRGCLRGPAVATRAHRRSPTSGHLRRPAAMD